LLIITVSFLPIFTMESQEGRACFSPLGLLPRRFSMAAAAILSITLVPTPHGVVHPRARSSREHKNPINRFLILGISAADPWGAQGPKP